MSVGLSGLLQFLLPDFVRGAAPETARRLVLAVGALYFAANAKERSCIENNIADLLGPGERTERVKRQVLAHIPEHYFEKLLVANRPPRFIRSFVRERVSADGLAVLDEALAQGRGILAVTTHWGAVELVPPLLADRGYPLSVVLETKTRRLMASLERLAAGQDVELLIASRGDSVLRGIFDALRRGRILLTQVDEVDAWRRRKSRTIRLFGQELFFDHTLDFIAKRALSPTVGLYCARSEGMRYALRCEPLALDPLAANVAVQALEFWERVTMRAPEQWYQWSKWGRMKASACGKLP